MAAREMTHDPRDGRFKFSESILTGATSDPVYLPSVQNRNSGFDPASVAVIPATSAKIEFTLSTRALVDAGTAVWHEWPNATVTVATSASIRGPITALRCVSVSGGVDWGIAAL